MPEQQGRVSSEVRNKQLLARIVCPSLERLVVETRADSHRIVQDACILRLFTKLLDLLSLGQGFLGSDRYLQCS